MLWKLINLTREHNLKKCQRLLSEIKNFNGLLKIQKIGRLNFSKIKKSLKVIAVKKKHKKMI
jgi:hypothetical protein